MNDEKIGLYDDNPKITDMSDNVGQLPALIQLSTI